MKKLILPILALVYIETGYTQTTNDVLELLIRNGTIEQTQADSIRADAAIKQQEVDAKKKSFIVSAGKALQISAYTQVRYQFFQEEGKMNGFDIRRAYVDLKGSISPYFSYRLQTDFATSPKIVDALVELKLADYLNLTIGQQVIPFSLNNITSNTKLELADRVQSVEALASRKSDILSDNNGRDIGIAASGSLMKVNDLNLIDYRIGIFNGSGINKADLNEDKDVIGRLVFHPVKGLEIGGSTYYGFAPDSATFYSNNSSIKDKDKLAAKYFGVRERYGIELSYEYKFVNLKAEYISGKDGSISKAGYYVQLAAFVLPGKLQLVGRYDSYDKDKDKEDNISTNYTGGINLIFNPNILLQIAYTIRAEEGEAVDNNFGSVQLQASF
jgi:phosphate-selective porin OprO and OprP